MSTLQRRHYELIAGIINKLPPPAAKEIATHFADHITEPNFNRQQFFKKATQ